MVVETGTEPDDRQKLEIDIKVPLALFELAAKLQLTARSTAIFGPSGAGKSTLLKALAGIERRARGLVRLAGTTWLDSASGIRLRPEQRGIGYVPQDGLLFPHRNVRGNLLAGAGRGRKHRPDPAATFAEVCALLEIEDLLDRQVDSLSGGERQRVALGRAICSGPQLLLLDEPLAALDLPLRRRALPLLGRIRDQLKIPLVLVSHDPVEVQALCDEVVAMDRGRVLAHGPTSQVLTLPEVFPLARDIGFENVLPAIVLDTGNGETQLRLGDGAGSIVLRTTNLRGQKGDSLWVGIAARDVILATFRPKNISARNVLPAKVLEEQAAGEVCLITVELDDRESRLAVEVTPGTVEELRLVPGRAVFVIVKAASCRLYESTA